MKMLQYTLPELPETLIFQVLALEEATWPPQIPNLDSDAEKIEHYRDRHEGTQAFLILEDKKVRGYAEIFPRTVFTAKGPLEIMGLARVCVARESRGLGLGKHLVKACFKVLDESPVEVCLFQTVVPDFYHRFNCRAVTNSFLNKKNIHNPQMNPFWDDYIMIYPATYAWPEGPIDLNGKGY